MNNLSHNLLLIRKEVLGISRKDFAEFIGVFSEYSLQNYESGEINPKPGYIKEIARKVGISESDLVNKKLTKKDIPVIVINQPQASTEPIDKLLEEKNQLIQSLQKQIEQQQKVIEILSKDA
jgi:transcriptional regulator with XRE-family HTH domain